MIFEPLFFCRYIILGNIKIPGGNMFKLKKNWPLDLNQTILPEAYIIHQKVEPKNIIISNEAYSMPEPEPRHAHELPKTPQEYQSVIIIEL
jgi:hypothetical protein